MSDTLQGTLQIVDPLDQQGTSRYHKDTHNKCRIIYGYKRGCLDNIDIENSFVILIEPRSDYIDEIKSLGNKKITLISKVLVKENKLSETILYYDKDSNSYFMKRDNLVINGVNLFNIKKYKVYTTSIENIIKQYSIQNIESLVVNINIKNCNEILQSVESYNHILSRIYIDKEIANYNCKILDNFYKRPNKKEDTHITELSTTKLSTIQDIDNLVVFTHKNLNIKLPKIILYFYENECKQIKEISLFLQQYKMNLVINDKTDEEKIKKIIISYPECIKYINLKNTLKPSKIYYENIIENLECIFDRGNDNDDLEIIIQFNPKYFNSKNTLQIMYPLQDNVVYVNKAFDIIYGTKNCMFMLYQILRSNYFTDYIEEKMEEKRTLFKIFSKRYFYDYISKIFVLKEIN